MCVFVCVYYKEWVYVMGGWLGKSKLCRVSWQAGKSTVAVAAALRQTSCFLREPLAMALQAFQLKPTLVIEANPVDFKSTDGRY